MEKSQIKKIEKELLLYKIEKSKCNLYNKPFEIWKKNKRYGYYNFICYSDSDNKEQIINLILKKE